MLNACLCIGNNKLEIKFALLFTFKNVLEHIHKYESFTIILTKKQQHTLLIINILNSMLCKTLLKMYCYFCHYFHMISETLMTNDKND